METLEEECIRLRRENLYFRNFLKLDPNTEIPIKDEACDEVKISLDLKIINNTQPPGSPSSLMSPSEKIKLFRSLFRGREDVYAIRWENKAGRSGYSPACHNEWDRRVCQKPKIKCNECPHSSWLPITDKVIHDHLTGKHMIGVYPLMKDETCHFLALDFDKKTWQKDVLAFYEICKNFSVPAAIERSQSGNGAHVWIFFEEAIPAHLARAMGTGLITQTMQDSRTISLDSYDRLFPNQDTLPKGGFGNLIALPLQGNRRKNGNSVFLDDKLNIYPDPWTFLASITLMKRQEILSIIEKVNQLGSLIDVKLSTTDEEASEPWVPQIAGPRYPNIEEPLPQQVHVTLSNLLYIPCQNLPNVLVNQIKKIAAFQNPEFYKAQAMRLSTYGKPRIIKCYEEFPDHVGLPRGCEGDLQILFKHYNISINVHDKTQPGSKIAVNFIGKLRKDQKNTLSILLKHRFGILAATTAFGKTVIAAKLIAERKTNTLILVHRQQLLDQWRERLSTFYGIPSVEIGCFGGGRKKLTGNIDIAMLQSLSKQGVVPDEAMQYGQVIIDECHHLSAFSFEQVLKKVSATYVLGLTATPIRKDGHHPIIFMQCGPILHRVSSKSQIIASQIKHSVCVRPTMFTLPIENNSPKISDLYTILVNDKERNEQIANDVLSALEAGRTPLLLTGRTQHLEWFSARFRDVVDQVFILRGGMKKSERETILKAIGESKDGSKRLILSTGSYIGEGFDDPRLDTLFLTFPISWQGTLQQYVGRLHRLHDQKKDIIVYDYADLNISVLNKMHQKRLKKYHAIGYIVP
jgi:superfamily II DNA or RNA helicase